MSGVSVSHEDYHGHLLNQVFKYRNKALLELTVSLFCVTDFHKQLLMALACLKYLVISFQKFAAQHIGVLILLDLF